MSVFDKVMKSGDVSLLCFKSEDENLSAWNNIMNEYTEEFGVPGSYKRYLKHKIKAQSYFLKSYETGRRDLITLGEIEERKAAMEMNNQSVAKESISIIAARVSKRIGFRINPAEVTVREFYAFITVANGE